MTADTGGNDSFGSSCSAGVDGWGAWLAIGTSATALGLGAGGKAASGAGVLMTGAGFDVFVEPVRGGVAVFCVSVTTAALFGLFDTGAATGLGAFVSFVVVVAVVAVTGAGASGVAVVTGSVAGLMASVEICARRATAAVVSLFMIDAIISVARFCADVSVVAGVGD